MFALIWTIEKADAERGILAIDETKLPKPKDIMEEVMALRDASRPKKPIIKGNCLFYLLIK